MSKKSEPEPHPSAHQRIEKLTLERRAITERIIELERQGVRRGADVRTDVYARAQAMVDDGDAAIQDNGAELDRLFEQREALDRALVLAQQKATEEEGEHRRRLLEQERAEWIALLRKRVLTALALQKINRDFQAAKTRYGGLPTARFALLGLGHGGPLDEARQAAEELVRLGILTQKEIDG